MGNEITEALGVLEPQSVTGFLISISLCIFFSYCLRAIYKLHASRVGLVGQTSDLLPVLSLTVFLVIVTVKQSLALSLGLVGALSIVRFRTPVKEPEDLIYYFISIGIGLGFGANQNLLASTALLFIFAILIIQTKNRYGGHNGSFTVRIQSSKRIDDSAIRAVMENNCVSVELNRKELSTEANILVYSVSVLNLETLKDLTDQLVFNDPRMEISIIESKGHW